MQMMLLQGLGKGGDRVPVNVQPSNHGGGDNQ